MNSINDYSIVKKVLSLIIIDIFNLNNVWDEGFSRRFYNHINNNDYRDNRKSELYVLPKVIDNSDLNELIKLMDHPKNVSANTMTKFIVMLFGGYYTNKPPLYKDDFDKNTSDKLHNIGNSIIPKLEKVTGRKLKLHDGKLSVFVNRYSGTESEFEWHYDRDSPNFYKVVLLLYGEGEYSNFEYYNNETQKEEEVKLLPGDCVLFNGKQTYHRIPPSTDKNSKRLTLLFQYEKLDCDEIDKNDCKIMEKKSFCNMLPDKNILYIILLITYYIFIENFLSVIIKNSIPNEKLKLFINKIKLSSLVIISILITLCLLIFGFLSIKTYFAYYLFVFIFFNILDYKNIYVSSISTLIFLIYIISSNKILEYMEPYIQL